VASLLQTVADNQAAATEAAAALHAGLANTDAQLSSTSTEIKTMGNTDHALVKAEITAGLKTLRESNTLALKTQNAAIKEKLRLRREELEQDAAALEAQFVAKWETLNSSLVELQEQQVHADTENNDEITNLLALDRQARAVLGASMYKTGQSLAAAKVSFQLSKDSVVAAQARSNTLSLSLSHIHTHTHTHMYVFRYILY
jgi:hypothetical protein